MSQHIEPGMPCLITHDLFSPAAKFDPASERTSTAGTTCVFIGIDYEARFVHGVAAFVSDCTHPDLIETEVRTGRVSLPLSVLVPLKGDEDLTDQDVIEALRTDTVPVLDEVAR